MSTQSWFDTARSVNDILSCTSFCEAYDYKGFCILCTHGDVTVQFVQPSQWYYIFTDRITLKAFGIFDTLLDAQHWIDTQVLLNEVSAEHAINIDI